jgi:GNAT superfamily N-acetyltransferase
MPLAPGYHVAAADPAIAPALPAIERAAAALFPEEDLPRHLVAETKSLDELAEAAREGMLWVAFAPDGRPAGFALVDLVDGTPHLDEIDVHPDHGRRGIGTALIETVCTWAVDCGFAALTLSTFRHLPWNAPFYARLGFAEITEDAWGSGLRALRRSEKAIGLDLARRVFMRRTLAR